MVVKINKVVTMLIEASRVILYRGEQSEGTQNPDSTVENTHHGVVESNKLSSKLRGGEEGDYEVS